MMNRKNSNIFSALLAFALIASSTLWSCSTKNPTKTRPVRPEVDSSVAAIKSPVDMFKELDYDVDTFYTSQDREIDIIFIRHASLAINVDDYLVYIDPTTIFGDHYTNMPKGDLVLVTHAAKSHCDPKAIIAISNENTIVLGERQANGNYPDALPMEKFQICNVDSTYGNHGRPFKIYSVPAYTTEKPIAVKNPRSKGGLGFIFDIDDVKIYISGNSEFNEDMNQEYTTEFTSLDKKHPRKEHYKPFNNVDIAFLSIDKVTMSPLDAIDATNSIRPDIVYPYHYSNTDLTDFFRGLAGNPYTETRRRRMGSIPIY